MTDDPVYTYIKGEGWVYSNHPTVTLRNGEKYLIVERTPIAGEKYLCGNLSNKLIKPNNDLNLERFSEFISEVGPRWLAVWQPHFTPDRYHGYRIFALEQIKE
jgi:hypothetical protein